MNQITPEHLKTLRNDVDVAEVIRALEIPTEHRGARVTFRCPQCARFHTALSAQRNRAHIPHIAISAL